MPLDAHPVSSDVQIPTAFEVRKYVSETYAAPTARTSPTLNGAWIGGPTKCVGKHGAENVEFQSCATKRFKINEEKYMKNLILYALTVTMTFPTLTDAKTLTISKTSSGQDQIQSYDFDEGACLTSKAEAESAASLDCRSKNLNVKILKFRNRKQVKSRPDISRYDYINFCTTTLKYECTTEGNPNFIQQNFSGNEQTDSSGRIWTAVYAPRTYVDAEKFCLSQGGALPSEEDFSYLTRWLGKGSTGYNPYSRDGKEVLKGLTVGRIWAEKKEKKYYCYSSDRCYFDTFFEGTSGNVYAEDDRETWRTAAVLCVKKPYALEN